MGDDIKDIGNEAENITKSMKVAQAVYITMGIIGLGGLGILVLIEQINDEFVAGETGWFIIFIILVFGSFAIGGLSVAISKQRMSDVQHRMDKTKQKLDSIRGKELKAQWIPDQKDWKCDACGEDNVFSQNCKSCGQENPHLMDGYLQWTCPMCEKIVKGEECECGIKAQMPNKWVCPKCKFNNVGQTNICQQCGFEYPIKGTPKNDKPRKPPNFRNQLPEDADPNALDNLKNIEQSCQKCIKSEFNICREFNYMLKEPLYTVCDAFKPRPVWVQVGQLESDRCIRCKFADVKYFMLNFDSAHCNKFDIPVDNYSKCKDFVHK